MIDYLKWFSINFTRVVNFLMINCCFRATSRVRILRFSGGCIFKNALHAGHELKGLKMPVRDFQVVEITGLTAHLILSFISFCFFFFQLSLRHGQFQAQQ